MIEDASGKADVSERRQFHRKKCLLAVDLTIKDSFFSNSISNISLKGMFIDIGSEDADATNQDVKSLIQGKLSIGQEIFFKIMSPRHLAHEKKIKGYVVRIDDRGIGVEFDKDPDYQAMVAKIVDHV